jgi:hypothetical protein
MTDCLPAVCYKCAAAERIVKKLASNPASLDTLQKRLESDDLIESPIIVKEPNQ